MHDGLEHKEMWIGSAIVLSGKESHYTHLSLVVLEHLVYNEKKLADGIYMLPTKPCPYCLNRNIKPFSLHVRDYTPDKLISSLVEEDREQSENIIVEIEHTTLATSESIGRALDKFLGPHPWWYVKKEPFKWDHTNNTLEIVLGRFDKKWDPIFQQISATQYPISCNQSLLRLEVTGGFDSFGNKFFNYISAKNQAPWGVFVPFVSGISQSFLDDKSCSSHIKNKFDCAFIPTTNCTLPDDLIVRKKLVNTYSNAGQYGTPVNGTYFHALNAIFHNKERPKGSNIFGSRHGGMFTKQHLRSVNTSSSPYNILFGYGFLYRPNHHFRSLIAHIIQEWKKKLDLPFPTNGDCVAVRIRRGDRTVGDQDAYEWCRQHVIHPNGSCLNDQTGKIDKNPECVHFYDMGCQTEIPFGAVTLEQTLNATRAISQSKNVLVGCDDAEWLRNQIKITQTDLNIFPFTAPPNHRRSTNGGAHYMAAIELASQCSSLVGHTGSAVTKFFYDIMCVRHAGHMGLCPPLYDLSEG
eukprot:gene1910-3698_t